MTVKDDSDVVSKRVLDWLSGISTLAAALVTIFAVFLTEEQAKPLAFVVAILFTLGSSAIYLYRRRSSRFKAAEPTEPLANSASLRGLLPFEDGDQLPGRARDVQELYTLVASKTFRFGVLWGESGCGKTSVLRAGLMPRLRTDKFLPLYVGKSTKDPREAIRAALVQEYSDLVKYDGSDLVSLLRMAAPRGTKIIIVLDQFEEFFLINRTARSRTSFIRWLGESIADDTLSLGVLISIRADFFGLLQNLAPQIPEPTSPRSTYQLQNFDIEQAKQIFTLAAKADAIAFDPELVDAVISDLAIEENIRPAELQIVGTRLKRKNILNLNRYEISGRARGILSSYISDEAKQSVREPAARLILRLMCAEVVETRSPTDLTLEEIALKVNEPDPAAGGSPTVTLTEVRSILSQFVDARIVIHTDDDKYNLIHDYLASYVRSATEGAETNVERANRLVKRHVAEYCEDPRTRIPFGRVRWIQKHASAEVKHGDKASELLRKSTYQFYLTIAAVIALPVIATLTLWGLLSIQEQLRGTWQLNKSLTGAQVLLIQPDPRDSDTVYVVSYGDAGVSGASLYVWHNGQLELRANDFIGAAPTAMTIVSSTLYVTTYGVGIARSRDSGYTWELINSGLPSRGITSIASDPADPQTLYVGTSDFRGILRSRNGGDAWSAYDYDAEMLGAQITILSFSDSNGGVLLAGTEDGRIVGHKRDSANWMLFSNRAEGRMRAMAVSQSDPKIVYAGTGRGIILRSQDGGLTWQSLGQIAHQYNILCLAIAPNDSRHVLATTYGNGGYTVWESLDGGETWSITAGLGLPRVTTNSIAYIAGTATQIFAGTSDGLFVSVDGASTWGNVNLHGSTAMIQGIGLSEISTAPIYVYRGGSVYTNLTGDLGQWLYGTGLTAEIVRTVVADPQDPQVAYAGVLLLGEWSVFKTQNGGQSWQRTTPPAITPGVPDTVAIAIARQPSGKDSVVYAGTLGCGLFRSIDGGSSWETFGRSECRQTAVSGMPADIFALAVDAAQVDRVYVAAGQQIFLSNDGGRTWQTTPLLINSPIVGLKADPVTPDVVYLITAIDGFWRSEDGGMSWNQFGDEWLSNARLSALQIAPGRPGVLVIGATNGAIWFSSDAGQTWQLKRENLAVGSITSIVTSKVLDGRVLVGTYRDGIGEFIPGRLFGEFAK